jgi:hypothetical protein
MQENVASRLCCIAGLLRIGFEGRNCYQSWRMIESSEVMQISAKLLCWSSMLQ